MAMVIVDPQDFVRDGMFREADFLESVSQYNWDRCTNNAVLVRGCGDIIFPSWALMTITAKLVPLAKTVRFGNEHSNTVIFRKKAEE